MDIQGICNKINSIYSQQYTPEYYKPYKIDRCVVFFYGDGAIVAKGRFIRNIVEDDGEYYVPSVGGLFISDSYIPSLIHCLEIVNMYLRKYGKPYYYSGTNNICGYELVSE